MAEEGLEVLGWREVPTDPIGAGVGRTALDVMPAFEQLFLGRPRPTGGQAPPASSSTASSTRPASGSSTTPRPQGVGVYFPSLSSRTMVYKGMLTTMQLPAFFPDLRDERVRRARSRIVHSPVLHQHLPVLAAGAPVPVRRAQR